VSSKLAGLIPSEKDHSAAFLGVAFEHDIT